MGGVTIVRLRNRSQKVEMLQSIPLFAHLTKKHLEEIARHSDEVEVADGHVLAREGTGGHELFVIVDGTARITRNGGTIATLQRGDFVGEMSLLDGQPRSATVIADGPMSVLVISGREFQPLLLDIPELGVRMLKALASRLRSADDVPTN